MNCIDDNGDKLVDFIRTASVEKVHALLAGAAFHELVATAPVDPRPRFAFSVPVMTALKGKTFQVTASVALMADMSAGKTEGMPLAA